MPLNAYYITHDGKLQTGLGKRQVIEAYQAREGLLWADIAEITEEDGKLLEEGFRFHHLAVEDCLSTRLHSPKIDNFNVHLPFLHSQQTK